MLFVIFSIDPLGLELGLSFKGVNQSDSPGFGRLLCTAQCCIDISVSVPILLGPKFWSLVFSGK